jgi:CheY-like chemotaxis protein
MMGRVLVVDDEESIRTLIDRVLSRQGFKVETAADGQRAIEKIAQGEFDAIVLDLMMPRVDGFSVLRHLIATNPELISKTVVATAFPRDATNAQLDEVCRVIIKPFDTGELIDAVRECVAYEAP